MFIGCIKKTRVKASAESRYLRVGQEVSQCRSRVGLAVGISRADSLFRQRSKDRASTSSSRDSGAEGDEASGSSSANRQAGHAAYTTAFFRHALATGRL